MGLLYYEIHNFSLKHFLVLDKCNEMIGVQLNFRPSMLKMSKFMLIIMKCYKASLIQNFIEMTVDLGDER
jgi:hypothetical protein